MWIRKTVHGWIRKKVHVYIVFLGGSEVCWISGSNLIWNAQKKLQHQLSELSEDWCWLSALSVGSLMFSPFLLVLHLFYLVFSKFLQFVCVFCSLRQWPWHGRAGRAGRVSVSQGLASILDLEAQHCNGSVSLPRLTPPALPARFFHERYCNILQCEAICERLRKALSQLFLCVSFISFTVDRRRRKYSRKGSKCPEHPEMLRNIM